MVKNDIDFSSFLGEIVRLIKEEEKFLDQVHPSIKEKISIRHSLAEKGIDLSSFLADLAEVVRLVEEREKSLDQVQPLIDEKGRVMRIQAETGKNFSTILADLDRRIKSALSGKSQENE